MDQSLTLSGASVPREAGTRQTIAAVLFAVWMGCGILTSLGLRALLLQEVSTASPAADFALRAFVSLLPLAGFMLLISGAANRAAKTAAVLLSAATACVVLCSAVCALYLSDRQEAVNLLTIYSYAGYVQLAYSVVSLYAFGVLLRSNAVEDGASSWIGLLMVDASFSLTRLLPMSSISFFDQENAFGSVPGILFMVVWQSLLIVAFVRFARSTAFSGRGAEAPEGACSPLNKYMAGAVAAWAVTLALLWAVFRFAAPWLRTL